MNWFVYFKKNFIDRIIFFITSLDSFIRSIILCPSQLKRQSEEVSQSSNTFKDKLKDNLKFLSQLNGEMVAATKKVKEAEKAAASKRKEIDETSAIRDRLLTTGSKCYE